MEIDQEPFQSNVSINEMCFAKDASMKFWESDWICVFFEHEKFSYVIGLAFVRDVVSLFHSLESQCQSRMKERAVNLTCL